MNTNFKVIGVTRLGIKPESTAQETDVELSVSGSVDLGFDSESGQNNDLKIGIHSFVA